MKTLCLWAVVSALVATPALAQSAYVAGAIGAEIVRTTTTRSGSSSYDAGSGEALGGAIRAGTLVAPRFGVEVEFFRAGRIQTDANGPIYYAAASGPGQPLIADVIGSSLPIIGQTVRVRATTTSALAFARQSVGSRFDLVYLGGISFARVVHDVEYNFPRGLVLTPQGYSTRTTQYGVGPVVGVEGRVGMTEHARFLAGVRLHELGDSLLGGWLIRPSVGLSWTF